MKRKTSSIRKTARDNWYGYIGGKKVVSFDNSPIQTQEQAAIEWKRQQEAGR